MRFSDIEVTGDLERELLGWSDGTEATLERGKEDRQMGIWTGYYGGIFLGSVASKGRREKGLHVFKMGEPCGGANAIGKKQEEGGCQLKEGGFSGSSGWVVTQEAGGGGHSSA